MLKKFLSIYFPGKYYVSVVGYNNALSPSEVSCSDGIIYDTTPPEIHNVTLSHAKVSLQIGCINEEAWLINSNFTRIQLANTSLCREVCSNVTKGAEHLPLSGTHILEEPLSEHYCNNLPMFTSNTYLHLPSDYIKVTWQGFDAESQMEDYYIGIGSDSSTSSAPDLLPLTSTQGHRSYHARHSGLGHGDVLYIFLQALNKAGTKISLTLGPILIDETPPITTEPIDVKIEDKYFIASWRNETFIDPEQDQNGIEFKISFRIGKIFSFTFLCS